MFQPTKNPYKFKYLITGITGDGIRQVYLPEKPADKDILDLGGRKWQRTPLPKEWKEWRKEEAAGLKEDPDFFHPQIEAFNAQEWERRNNGIWFWNGKVATYITGFYYYYLNWICLDFGYPDYRETDKEVTYFLDYCVEDPASYGILYNTLRRGGKSSLMGGWMLERITRTRNANGAIQGEKFLKAASFFNKCVLYPFRKLPDFFRPEYDKDSKNKGELLFYKSVKRGRKDDDDFDFDNQLESKIDYRDSGTLSYDGEKIFGYVGEEIGKTKECDVYERWNVIKFTLEENSKVWGKHFGATTVEEMAEEGSAGDNYWKLFADSDVDVRVNGKTKSGLYACFLPADCGPCAVGTPYDEHGHPKREINVKTILADREALKDHPALLAGLIRKKPLNIEEAFYSDSQKCEFNVMVLETRKSELLRNPNIAVRGNLDWVGGIRDGNVVWIRDDVNGRFLSTGVFDDEKDSNQVTTCGITEGVTQWMPMNDKKFAIGTDPIQHGVTAGNVQSKAAAHGIRKYDASIEGILTDAILEQRRLERYQYKTGIPVIQYHHRPVEPTLYFEDMIKLCRYLGCQIHIENQKNAIMHYFKARGYSKFVMNRVETTFSLNAVMSRQMLQDGTPASQSNTQHYTGLLATHIQYFGHCIPFKDLIEQLLKFDPLKTTKFDLCVSLGYGIMALESRIAPEKRVFNLEDYFGKYDNSGYRSV